MTRTGLVLAGGLSRRFGGGKPFAELEGRSLVRRVCDVLAERCDELVVSTGTDEDARRFAEAVPAARMVPDAQPGRGPVEGLLRGFGTARGNVVLVAPCDAPLLQASLYDGLLAILGDHDAALPRHAAMDPIRAVYRRGPAMEILRARSVPSPSALVDRLDAAFLEGDALRAADPGLVSFVDVNRPEDLAAARQLALRAAPTPPSHHSY